MLAEIPIQIITAASGLLGATIGAVIALVGQRSVSEANRLKMLSEFTSTTEVEKARIASYLELWKILAGASVREEHTMKARLPELQNKLQNWYYSEGNGLLMKGGATKNAFFAARDLRNNHPYEIWKAFHELGKCLRRDLRIFDDEADEESAIKDAESKLARLNRAP